MEIKAKLKLPDYKKLETLSGLNKTGKVQQCIDAFVLYKSEPFEPGRHIHQSGVIGTKIGSGKVIWDSPDANYLYEGMLMVDPITLKGAFFNSNYGFWSRPNTQKIIDPKNRDLKFIRGGSHWFEKINIDELLEDIEKIVGGKND